MKNNYKPRKDYIPRLCINYNENLSSIANICKDKDFIEIIKHNGYKCDIVTLGCKEMLRILCQEDGQKYVANKIGCSEISLRHFLNGQKPLSKKFFAKVLEYLQVVPEGCKDA